MGNVVGAITARVPPRVYLAGPIRGMTYTEAGNWRGHAAIELSAYGIEAINPLRVLGYEHAAGPGTLPDAFPGDVMNNQRAVTTRSRLDTFMADALLVNLADAEQVSIGTMIEIGWADARRIPIVTVMPGGNAHEHCMVRECSDWVVDTLEDGVAILGQVLGARG